MISELDRLIELGALIGKNTNGDVEVDFHVFNINRFRDKPSLETWIYFYDEKNDITASYFYRDDPCALNILTMLFNESREK